MLKAVAIKTFLVPKFNLGMTSATLVAGRRASLNEFPNRVWELEKDSCQKEKLNEFD
jgi:hypothetical protein